MTTGYQKKILGIAGFIFSSSLFQDTLGVIRYGKSSLITMEGVPLYSWSPCFSFSSYQKVLIKKQNGDKENCSFCFFPTQIHIGKLQRFFIAPHSQEVLEAELLE